MQTNSRILSVKMGLMPPDHEALSCYLCGHEHHGHKGPTQTEIELAARKHRWKDMQQLQARYFKDLAARVTEYETDILEMLELPDIETVRRAAQGANVSEGGSFSWTDTKKEKYFRVLNLWFEDVTGEKYQKDATESGILQTYSEESLLIGLNHTLREIRRNYPFDPADLFVARPEQYSEYLRAMNQDALKRVKTKFAQLHRKEVVALLEKMAGNGEWPIRVGKELHKTIGEGHLWYWNRIARSESVLALNVAYNVQSNTNGVNYDKWSAAPGACPICTAFTGNVWRRGEGPEPVSSTHPHCGCTRIPLFEWAGNVREPWTRETPYDNPYTTEELDAFRRAA